MIASLLLVAWASKRYVMYLEYHIFYRQLYNQKNYSDFIFVFVVLTV